MGSIIRHCVDEKRSNLCEQQGKLRLRTSEITKGETKETRKHQTRALGIESFAPVGYKSSKKRKTSLVRTDRLSVTTLEQAPERQLPP